MSNEQINELQELAQNEGIQTTEEEVKTPFKTKNVSNWLFFMRMENDYYHNGDGTVNIDITENQPNIAVTKTEPAIKNYLSASKLKAAISPLHLKKYFNNKPSGEVINAGSAIHALVAEPENFEYRVMNDEGIIREIYQEAEKAGKTVKSPKSTKKYREWKQQFQDADGNLASDVISKETFQSMWSLSKLIESDKQMKKIIKAAIPELSIFTYYKTPFFKYYVKIRPDLLLSAYDINTISLKEYFSYDVPNDALLYISIKSTIDGSFEGFERQCQKMKYDIAEALYVDVLQSIYQRPVLPVFLVLEKDSKNLFTGAWNLRIMTDEFISAGREKYNEHLDVWNYVNYREDYTPGYEFLAKSRIKTI